MKAWGGHTPNNFSLRTDVSYSFFARRKVTSAVSIPQRLKGAKIQFDKRRKNVSVLAPALTLSSGTPITRHWTFA